VYVLILNEIKAVLNVSAQAGQSGAVNKSAVVSMAQDDDFQEIKRRKKHISNVTSWTAKKSTMSVPTFATVTLPLNVVLTRKLFGSLTILTTIGAENRLPKQEDPRNHVCCHQ
jgi:hypothetical protein